MATNFDESRLRSERNHNRGYRAARQDINYGTGGVGARFANDMAREAATNRDREFWVGYRTAMKAAGKP